MKKDKFMEQQAKDMSVRELISAIKIKYNQDSTHPAAKPEEKKSLSDKIINMIPNSLEYPHDGRRICELKSNSELLCQRVSLIIGREIGHHGGCPAEEIYLLDIKDIREALKEFLGELKAPGITEEFLQRRTKEIFGDKLL